MSFEVKKMEEKRMDTPETEIPEEELLEIPEAEIPEEEPQKPVYKPRPSWQVWAARVGLVIMIISIILYYWHIASGGR